MFKNNAPERIRCKQWVPVIVTGPIIVILCFKNDVAAHRPNMLGKPILKSGIDSSRAHAFLKELLCV